MNVEGLSGGCRAGLTLNRCQQLLAVYPIKPDGSQAVPGLVGSMVLTRCTSPEHQFGAFWEVWHAVGESHFRGKPDREPQHAQASCRFINTRLISSKFGKGVLCIYVWSALSP